MADSWLSRFFKTTQNKEYTDDRVEVRVRVRRIISRFCRMVTVVVLELQQPQSNACVYWQITIGEQSVTDKIIGVLCVVACSV